MPLQCSNYVSSIAIIYVLSKIIWNVQAMTPDLPRLELIVSASYVHTTIGTT